MRTEVLQGLIEIVHENSIRKAAQRLDVPQQTLNKNITSLETELGVRILERTNQGVRLTDAGTEVYQFAKWCLHEYTIMQDDCTDCLEFHEMNALPKQKIVLGCVDTAIQNIVSKAIAESYRTQYSFELFVVQDNVLDIMQKVKNDEYKIGITLQYQGEKINYPQFDDSLQFIPIYQSKPYVWVSKKSYLSSCKHIEQKTFQKYNVIRLKDSDERMTNFIFDYNGLKKLKIITCQNIYYATHMLELNLGAVIDMKTNKYLNLEKWLGEIAVPLPLKLKDDYKIVTGILLNQTLLPAEVGHVVEYLLQQNQESTI